jgi:beta-galactosidase
VYLAPRFFFSGCVAILLVIGPSLGHSQLASQTVDLSAGPWRLLVDQNAAWRTDPLYLPEDVDIQTLPVPAPTGGWQALSDTAGIPVTLPSTVEEHYWGQLGLRPYSAVDEYRWAAQDPYLETGNYLGVSWWYQTFSAPTVPAGEHLLVHLQGSRLRTEIYVNGKLCGYSILSELPVDADITSAVQAGAANQLAIRITNADGRWDWRDWWPFSWGSHVIPSSIGAGGLDTGVTLAVVNATRISDLAVLNQPEPHQIQLQAEVTNQGADYNGAVVFRIKNAAGAVVQTLSVPAEVAAGATSTLTGTATLANAALWTLEAPTLYTATATLRDVADSGATRTFGYRSFTAVGIGTNAMLQLNQQRIVLRSAISWGFWAPNGIWPTATTEQSELQTAKAMGLNCIQSHRNLSKTMTLDAQDAAGLLRYEEPGAGTAALATGAGPLNDGPPNNTDVQSTSGVGGEPTTFTEKYEEDKILAMIKRDRSHPSVIMYCIQNELVSDLHNPHIYNLIKKMHTLDPSRIVVLKSGGVASGEAYMLPNDNTVYIDDGTGYSGWHDNHTVGGPGTWSRSLYTNPTNFSHRSTGQRQIVMWGEMLGAGTPNDHRRIVADYAQTGTSGYDRNDEAMFDAAYASFFQQYGFTAAFPTTSALYSSIADKSYYEWQRMLENTRMCDETDYIVMSGWESTSIENQSGLLDAHRVPKADPAILGQANAPLMVVVRPRRFVLSTGQPVMVDVFLVNEVGLQGPARLTLTATGPTGHVLFNRTVDVNITGGDVFGQLLHQGFDVPGAVLPGDVTLTGTLAPSSALPAGVSSTSLVRNETLSVYAPVAGAMPQRTVLVDSSGAITPAFEQFYHAPVLPASALSSGKPVDAIVLSSSTPNAGDGPAMLAAALKQVYDNGARLVIWPDTGAAAMAYAQILQANGVLTVSGSVGSCRAPWMGSWYFVRDNPIFNGLPVNTALDHRYELPQEGIGENGLLLAANGLQAYVGYGRDHDPTLGIGLCVIPWGKGSIVLSSIASEVTGLTDSTYALARPIALRLLSNALTQPLQ